MLEKYVLLSLDEADFNDIVAGKRLYLYKREYIEDRTRAFIFIPEQNKIVALIDFEKIIKVSEEEVKRFVEDHDKGKVKDVEKLLEEKVSYILPIVKTTLFIPLDKERLDFEISESFYEISENDDILRNLTSYSKENYLSTIEYEQEMKILCTEEDFYRLYNEFVNSKNPIKQVNYYFDKDFYLYKQGITLRIREKNDKYVLTVKEKKNKDQDLSTEKTESISKETFLKILENSRVRVDDYIQNTIVGDYKLIGSLETYRDEIPFNNVLLAFDVNHYFGKTDYEIEMEGNHIDLIKLYESIKIDKLEESGKSKLSRFMDEYKKNN